MGGLTLPAVTSPTNKVTSSSTNSVWLCVLPYPQGWYIVTQGLQHLHYAIEQHTACITQDPQPILLSEFHSINKLCQDFRVPIDLEIGPNLSACWQCRLLVSRGTVTTCVVGMSVVCLFVFALGNLSECIIIIIIIAELTPVNILL